MAGIDDYKITDTSGQKISDLPGTSMSGSVADNKAAFDKLGELIIAHYNDLIDYVKNNIQAQIINTNSIYPVGSIYLSVSSTNPTTLFGGTWVQMKDTFLLGAGDNYVAGSTGGSADATLPAHTHTLTATADSAGAHTHSVSGTTQSSDQHRHAISSGGYSATAAVTTTAFYRGSRATSASAHYSDYSGAHTHRFSAISSSNGGHTHTITGTADSTGTSATGANLPPYTAVYVWKRTA